MAKTRIMLAESSSELAKSQSALMAMSIGKKHALKIYDQFALNTSCFWESTRSNIIPFFLQFHEIFDIKLIYYIVVEGKISWNQHFKKYSFSIIVFKEKGLSGLFSGILPRVAWISVGGALFLGIYDLSVSKFKQTIGWHFDNILLCI